MYQNLNRERCKGTGIGAVEVNVGNERFTFVWIDENWCLPLVKAVLDLHDVLLSVLTCRELEIERVCEAVKKDCLCQKTLAWRQKMEQITS